jgi:hypothetical protein
MINVGVANSLNAIAVPAIAPEHGDTDFIRS